MTVPVWSSSAVWASAVTARDRVTEYRVEAIGSAGTSLGPVPVDGVRIDYSGEQAESWRADFALSDPSMVPTSTRSWLDGRSGVRFRVWWGIDTSAGWMECPVGTYVIEDPQTSDKGTLSIGVPGLDPLAVARRGGYGSRVIPVGGLTVSDALGRLFGAVVPGYPLQIAPSTATLPATYELWDRDPAEDWTEIAAMAGMVVRTDRMGVITVAPPPSPTVPVADWREGPTCPVAELTSQVKTSTIPRRVVVVSTSHDVAPPVVGEWINPDADAMSIITETRVESSTVTTVEAATSLARMTGERWARPQQSVAVTVPARPDLDYRDVVTLARAQAAVSGTYQVSGWSMNLAGRDTAPAPMRVTMMTRQV